MSNLVFILCIWKILYNIMHHSLYCSGNVYAKLVQTTHTLWKLFSHLLILFHILSFLFPNKLIAVFLFFPEFSNLVYIIAFLPLLHFNPKHFSFFPLSFFFHLSSYPKVFCSLNSSTNYKIHCGASTRWPVSGRLLLVAAVFQFLSQFQYQESIPCTLN